MTGPQRLRLAAQPWLGLGGLLLTAVVFFVLALGTGSAATGLLILGPISTFGLAGVAMIAFWWNDWPGSRLSAPWSGVIDTLLVAAIAVVLTIAGQAVVERPDIRAAPEDWVTSASLSFAGAAIILHVGIGFRWPFAGLRRDAVAQRLPDDVHPALRPELGEDAGDIGLDGT